ncbi:hypothetical protein OSTOST_16242, partial [Ostertagia ostertagi]
MFHPPLSRDPSTPDALMDMLAAGELHLTGTDNCTFNCQQKLVGRDDFTKIPNGVNGVEDRMSVVWDRGVYTGKIDPMRFVQITSSTAAKIFNIYPKKGRVAAVDFNIFEGMVVHGCSLNHNFPESKVVWSNNTLTTEAGSGRFIPLAPFAPYVFATIPQRAKAMAPRAVDRSKHKRRLYEQQRMQMESRFKMSSLMRSTRTALRRPPPGGASSIQFF